MPFVRGFLRVVGRGLPGHDLPDVERPVDPGFGNDPARPVDPGFGKPGFSPIDPGFGGGIANHPELDPDFGMPITPPGTWPPLDLERPWAPIPPDASTKPPGPDNMPGNPSVMPPIHKPGTPGQVWPPLTDGSLPDGKFWVIAGIPGVGWRAMCVDLNIVPPKPAPPTVAPK